MTQLFKGVALFVAITCVVWVSVLWRWESTSRNMTVFDIVMYLGVLPLVVFCVIVGLVWAWRGAAPRRGAAVAAAASARAAAQPAAPELSAGEEAQRHAVCQLLCAHLVTAAGASPGELLAAAAENKPRPSFDDDLRDAAGLQIMAARIHDLQPDDVAETLDALLADLRRERTEWATVDVREHAKRALAALREPLANTVQALRPWAVRLGAPDPVSPLGTGGSPAAATADLAPMVRMLLGWPIDWNELERELATRWARGLLSEYTEIPASRFALVVHAASGEALWLQADQLLQTLARERRSDVVLVAACHSDLSDSAVLALDEARRLFSAQSRPKGLIPGEAAAALLLAAENWPADPDAYQPPTRLHRPAVLRRDKSVEAVGRVGSQSLQDAVTNALAAAQIAPDAIPALVCDADQHTARSAELFGATLSGLPQLDPTEDMRLIGTVTGHTGAVNALLVVATAAERARTGGDACLALCVGDPFMRMALVARPAAMPTPLA